LSGHQDRGASSTQAASFFNDHDEPTDKLPTFLNCNSRSSTAHKIMRDLLHAIIRAMVVLEVEIINTENSVSAFWGNE